MYDALVVGAGPAGLSAALILGRCRRRVVVFDRGGHRNAPARALHGFLSRDGIKPMELVRLGREELEPYGVDIRDVEIVDAATAGDDFEVVTAGGERVRGRTLVLATGVADRVPELEGLAPLYGTSVFHCPYCDGWELRDRALAAYAREDKAVKLGLALLTWSRDVVLCTDGPGGLTAEQRERLERNGVAVREERVARLEGRDGRLERVVFADGSTLEREALFFKTGHDQASELPTRLGCNFNQGGHVRTDALERTEQPGLFVVGDASQDVQLAIIAAADGVKAGFGADLALTARDRR